MIRHIVMWNFKEGLSDAEKKQHGTEIKRQLEALKAIIPGVVELVVNTEPLASSGRELILNSLLESEEALDNYQVHPDHKKAGVLIGSVMQDRVAFDYHE